MKKLIKVDPTTGAQILPAPHETQKQAKLDFLRMQEADNQRVLAQSEKMMSRYQRAQERSNTILQRQAEITKNSTIALANQTAAYDQITKKQQQYVDMGSKIQRSQNMMMAGFAGIGGIMQSISVLTQDNATGGEKLIGVLSAMAPAIGALFGPWGMLAGMLVSVALAFFKVDKSAQEARDKIEKATAAAAESFQSNRDRILFLEGEIKRLEQFGMTAEDAANLKNYRNELAKLIPSLQTGVDQYGNAILTGNAAISARIDLLQKQAERQEELNRLKAVEAATETLGTFVTSVDVTGERKAALEDISPFMAPKGTKETGVFREGLLGATNFGAEKIVIEDILDITKQIESGQKKIKEQMGAVDNFWSRDIDASFSGNIEQAKKLVENYWSELGKTIDENRGGFIEALAVQISDPETRNTISTGLTIISPELMGEVAKIWKTEGVPGLEKLSKEIVENFNNLQDTVVKEITDAGVAEGKTVSTAILEKLLDPEYIKQKAAELKISEEVLRNSLIDFRATLDDFAKLGSAEQQERFDQISKETLDMFGSILPADGFQSFIDELKKSKGSIAEAYMELMILQQEIAQFFSLYNEVNKDGLITESEFNSLKNLRFKYLVVPELKLVKDFGGIKSEVDDVRRATAIEISAPLTFSEENIEKTTKSFEKLNQTNKEFVEAPSIPESLGLSELKAKAAEADAALAKLTEGTEEYQKQISIKLSYDLQLDQNQIETIEAQIDEANRRLLEAGLSDEERAQLLEKVATLQNDLKKAYDDRAKKLDEISKMSKEQLETFATQQQSYFKDLQASLAGQGINTEEMQGAMDAIAEAVKNGNLTLAQAAAARAEVLGEMANLNTITKGVMDGQITGEQYKDLLNQNFKYITPRYKEIQYGEVTNQGLAEYAKMMPGSTSIPQSDYKKVVSAVIGGVDVNEQAIIDAASQIKTTADGAGGGGQQKPTTVAEVLQAQSAVLTPGTPEYESNMQAQVDAAESAVSDIQDKIKKKMGKRKSLGQLSQKEKEEVVQLYSDLAAAQNDLETATENLIESQQIENKTNLETLTILKEDLTPGTKEYNDNLNEQININKEIAKGRQENIDDLLEGRKVEQLTIEELKIYNRLRKEQQDAEEGAKKATDLLLESKQSHVQVLKTEIEGLEEGSAAYENNLNKQINYYQQVVNNRKAYIKELRKDGITPEEREDLETATKELTDAENNLDAAVQSLVKSYTSLNEKNLKTINQRKDFAKSSKNEIRYEQEIKKERKEYNDMLAEALHTIGVLNGKMAEGKTLDIKQQAQLSAAYENAAKARQGIISAEREHAEFLAKDYKDRYSEIETNINKLESQLQNRIEQSTEYLKAQDMIIEQQRQLYIENEDRLADIDKILKNTKLTEEVKNDYLEEQNKLYVEQRNLISKINDSVKKRATDEFNLTLYGTANMDALKTQYELRQTLLDEIIDTHESLVERTQLELEIQKEIEESTNQTYKTNLKYLQGKIKDVKLTKQVIDSTRAQINLMKVLSGEQATGPLRLTRAPAGQYRFAPTAIEGAGAEASLKAAADYEKESISRYRELSDNIFSLEQQIPQMMNQGQDTSSLLSLLTELRTQRTAQGEEIAKAKTVSALVARGRSPLAMQLLSGRMGLQQASLALSAQDRKAVEVSTQGELGAVLSSQQLLIQSNFSIVVSNNKLIEAIDRFNAKLQAGITSPALGGTSSGAPSSASGGSAPTPAPGPSGFYQQQGQLGEQVGLRGQEVILYGASPANISDAKKYFKDLETELANNVDFRKTEYERTKKAIEHYKGLGEAGKSALAAAEKHKGLIERINNTSKNKIQFETGGYTGEFDGGKLAILHEKELVLNKSDTQNILDAVSISRSMPRFGTKSMPTINSNTNTGQNIVINAEFPNVSSADEIKKAFASMSSKALQYAYSTKSY
jgi:hypothetical protein